MPKCNVSFTVSQLIVGGKARFSVDDFASIPEDDFDNLTIGNGADQEVLTVKHIKKDYREDRFLTFYFEIGDRFPYSDKIVAPDLQEHDNPRSVEQIEMDEQIFVLIDLTSQQIYLSNFKKRGSIGTWLQDRIDQEVNIKAIVEEQEFIQNIKSIDEISFAIVPDLFHTGNQDTLSNHLAQDIFSFDAKKAEIKFSYNKSEVTDRIKAKIASLIGHKELFNKIVIIGRDDENLERVLNLEGVTSKISCEIIAPDRNLLFNHDDVFSSLISKIKETE